MSNPILHDKAFINATHEQLMEAIMDSPSCRECGHSAGWDGECLLCEPRGEE